MRIKKSVYFLIVLAVGFCCSACGQNPLLGKWQAEQPKDLTLPLSATLVGQVEFQEDQLVMADGQVIKCKYDVDDEIVTVSVGVGSGSGEVILMDGRSRMSRMIPSVGQVFYKKID